MSWVVMEGFDGLNNYAEIGLRSWRNIGAGLTYSSTLGRRGGGCIIDNTTGSTTDRGIEFGANYFRTTPQLYASNQTTVEYGMAIYIDINKADLTNGWTYPLASVYYLTTEILGWELYYNTADGGYWYVRQKYGATLKVNGLTSVMRESGRWYYLSFLVYAQTNVSGSNYNHILLDGMASGYIGGASGVNASTSTTPTLLKIGSHLGVSGNLPVGASIRFDDIIMASADGIPFSPAATSNIISSAAGPVRVDAVYGTVDHPTWDDQFVPSSGSDEFPMLNDAPHDGDTTYVQSSTPGHIAQGGSHINISTGGLPVAPTDILGVRTFAIVKNTGDGVGVVRMRVGSGSASGNATYSHSLPVSGAYEGVMSIGSLYEGASNGSATKWTAPTLQYAIPLLEYVS